MASLIVPKWMRSEFRSDIITRPRVNSRAGPQVNAGALGAWMGTRTYCVTGERGVQKWPQSSGLSNRLPPFCCHSNFFSQTAVKNKSPYF